MSEVYNGFMSQSANSGKCAKCGTVTDSRGMYQTSKPDGSKVLLCMHCWYDRGPKAPPRRPMPVAKHAKACFAASRHATIAAAIERAEVVAFHLGQRPEIFPREPGAAQYFVIGDSPLVKGFDRIKAPNPLA